jgi:outer membrane beta-barrel protein
MKSLFFFFCFLIVSSLFAKDNAVPNFEWLDEDKEIYVLQNRKYRKVNRFMLTAMGSLNFSDKFVNTFGGILKGTYFLREDWGIELGLGFLSSSENDTSKGVKSQLAIPFYRSVVGFTSASLVWSPFYGKFNTFNLIYYLDWYLSLGLASIQTEDNSAAFAISDDDSTDIVNNNFELRKESASGITWSTGFNWYLTKSFSLRLEFTGIHFQASKNSKTKGTSSTTDEKDQWFHNYNLNAGLNFMF